MVSAETPFESVNSLLKVQIPPPFTGGASPAVAMHGRWAGLPPVFHVVISLPTCCHFLYLPYEWLAQQFFRSCFHENTAFSHGHKLYGGAHVHHCYLTTVLKLGPGCVLKDLKQSFVCAWCVGEKKTPRWCWNRRLPDTLTKVSWICHTNVVFTCCYIRYLGPFVPELLGVPLG